MKKYLVIGNPINHSLSPKLHNYWIKKNNIDAVYEKRQLNKEDLKSIINEVAVGKINGINVTTPFKKSVIPFLDYLTPNAKEAQSVNVVYKKENKIFGDNTDIGGFELGLKYINYDVKNKKIFILGAGGVVPSIILALKRLGVSKISLSNRTKEKAESMKFFFNDLHIINWGENAYFEMIINATSLGLKKEDKINLDYSKVGNNKLFYDIIYNPTKTKFLEEAEKSGNKSANGKMMFIFQAQLAFKVWHKILPKIDDELIKLLDL